MYAGFENNAALASWVLYTADSPSDTQIHETFRGFEWLQEADWTWIYRLLTDHNIVNS